MKPSKIEKILAKAGCYRLGYECDLCGRHHKSYWAYDEEVCDQVIMNTGRTPRRRIGDGRAAGNNPIYPVSVTTA